MWSDDLSANLTPSYYELTSDEVVVKTESDILRLMEKAYPRRKMLLKQANFAPEFFDLSSGLAGAVLQKLVQYQMTTAIIVDLSKIKSERFKEMVGEANTNYAGEYAFFTDREKAVAWLEGSTE